MSVKGLYHVCERRQANHGCDRCGTLVCRIHFDAELGCCAECAERVKPNDRRRDTFRF